MEYFILIFSIAVLLATIIIILSLSHHLPRKSHFGNWRIPIVFTLIVVGIAIIVFFWLSAKEKIGDKDDFTLTRYGVIGDFIGGFVGAIFNLIGIVLLFETLSAQRIEFNKQQFESKFFELVKFHRENVSQMVHRVPWDAENYYDKARVFIEMKSQFESIYKITNTYAGTLSEKDRINISYLILFFGVSKKAREDLKHYFQRFGFDESITKSIVDDLYTMKTKYNPKTVYFGGHQVRLGHYFRNLFQAVKFVDKATFLTPQEKYSYVKILRAQLSQYELSIFFLNSLSIGREWEKNNYITEYKLIKNMPRNFIATINPKDYYSKFKYEWEKTA